MKPVCFTVSFGLFFRLLPRKVLRTLLFLFGSFVIALFTAARFQ